MRGQGRHPERSASEPGSGMCLTALRAFMDAMLETSEDSAESQIHAVLEFLSTRLGADWCELAAKLPDADELCMTHTWRRTRAPSAARRAPNWSRMETPRLWHVLSQGTSVDMARGQAAPEIECGLAEEQGWLLITPVLKQGRLLGAVSLSGSDPAVRPGPLLQDLAKLVAAGLMLTRIRYELRDRLEASRRVGQGLLEGFTAEAAVLNEDGKILCANAALAESAGVTVSSLSDRSLWSHSSSLPPSKAKRALARAWSTGSAVRVASHGETFEFRPLGSSTGSAPAAILYRRVATADLWRHSPSCRTDAEGLLLDEITQAEERERQRLAADLHDRVNQLLIGVRLELGALASQTGDAAFRDALVQSNSHLRTAIEEAYALIHEVVPPELRKLGLPGALRGLVADFGRRSGIRTSLCVTGTSVELSQQMSIFLYQAARELLANVAKHARATTARVGFSVTEQRLTLTVEDDGQGLTLRKAEARHPHIGHFGLASIRERLHLLGGTFQVTCSQAGGARFELGIPHAGGARVQGGSHHAGSDRRGSRHREGRTGRAAQGTRGRRDRLAGHHGP